MDGRTEPPSMQLVFRVAGFGCALPIDNLVEVCQEPGPDIEYEVAEAGPQGKGKYRHRGNLLTVYALAPALGLKERTPTANGEVVLILGGRAGFWGLVVDAVEGIFPAEEFSGFPLPKLLERETPLPFEGLLVWREELLHSYETLHLETFLRGA